MNFSNFKITVSVDKESFSKINVRPFIAGMVAVFVFKIFSIMGVAPTFFASPVPNNMKVFDTIQPKLEQKMNDFKLSYSSQLIPAAYAGGEYDKASSYIVFDLDSGKVLAEKVSNQELPIASITKVMTAVVALDLASPDELFTVSEAAAEAIPTKIGVIPGQQMTLEELLKAMLLTSANDASAVVREGIDDKYGEEIFIQAMNEKAKLLHMDHTSFANPQGFDDTHNYSTTADLAILSHYALNNYPLIKEIVRLDYAFIAENEYHKQFDLNNWNGLIGTYPNAYGVKIGNTGDAKVTTMVAAEREGKHVGVVLLGAPGILERDMWGAQLLDLGFEQLAGMKPIEVTEEQLREKYATWKTWN